MTESGFLIIGLIIGALAGGLVTWLFLRARAAASMARESEVRKQLELKETEISRLNGDFSKEQALRIEVETRYQEAEKNLLKQKELIESMETKVTETFKALSLDALTKNSEEFLKLADEVLKAQASNGRKELESKKELIDKGLETVAKTISEVHRKIEEIGQGSRERMAEMAGHIRKHAEVTSNLSDTTDKLRHTLASSKKRGEWGERMAEDIIRLVGLVEGINYIKQKALGGSTGRPDFTFFLPNSLKINMDVKFPLENYQRYIEAQTEQDRKRYRDELLKNTKAMIKEITGNREYINPEDNTVDYVIIFIPNEQVYSFINETDVTLMDESLRQKVILCSPFTLYAVLAVIRQAVENFNLEKTTSDILKLLGDFFKQWNMYKEKFKVMGDRLDAARKEYDALTTTRSNMLERPLKKIEEIRKQEAITFDEQIKLDETSLLE
jgi:DNA recombination protein RmuC